jgi:hypothetical protein
MQNNNNEQELKNLEDSRIKELEDELPEDIKEALNVIVGNRPKSFDQEFSPAQKQEKEFNGAAFGGASSQEEFIKKKDPQKKKIKLTKNKIHLLDISTQADTIKYEEIMDQIFDPENDIQLVEPIKDPQYIIDSNSPTGVRALLVIKTTIPVEYIKKEGTGYTVMEKQNKNT